MEYDRSDCFNLDFETNIILFGLKSKENCHFDHVSSNLEVNGNLLLRVLGTFCSGAKITSLGGILSQDDCHEAFIAILAKSKYIQVNSHDDG